MVKFQNMGVLRKTKVIIYGNTEIFTLLTEQNIIIKYNILIELKSYISAIKN